MASDRQIAANRENAQKSTGPKTPEGRAAVRLNGLKHGLSAETIVVMGEDPADFEALHDSLRAEHQPATPTEEILVRQLAVAAWRQLRFFRMEAGYFKNEDEERRNASSGKEYEALDADRRLARIASGDAINQKLLPNFHRYAVSLERSIRATAQELRRCRADRRAIGFGLRSSEQPNPAPNEPIMEMEIAETQPPPMTADKELAQDEPQAA